MHYIDLAVLAGKKRQSPQTGFVHFFPGEESSDTIPLFENFCFAFALIRQKTRESVTEGIQLIERLLPFQAEDGNFPIYLHEYPNCKDAHLGLKIAPIFVHALEDFSSVLEKEVKQRFKSALEKMIKTPCSEKYLHRYQALCGQRQNFEELNTPKDWFERIVSDQLFEKEKSYPISYNSFIQAFTGDHLFQADGEPQSLPIEYILAKEPLSKRLKKDHIHQLHAACLYPFSSSSATDTPYAWKTNPPTLLWQEKKLHSLVFPKAIFNDGALIFSQEPEAALFVDLSSDTKILVNQKRATVFYPDDLITIATPTFKIDLRFRAGPGTFCGHISRANRPGSLLNDPYKAYDWKINLREVTEKVTTFELQFLEPRQSQVPQLVGQ